MDVLRPEILVLGQQFYRVNSTIKPWQHDNVNSEEEYSPFDDEYYNVNKEESCDANLNVTPSGVSCRLSVSKEFYRYVIGQKGETKKKLESETKTEISIPHIGQSGDIVIKGKDCQSVSSARTRIEILIESRRQKMEFTHFLSIPLTTQPMQDSLCEFKDLVLGNYSGCRGIDSSVFQNPSKLHLTLCTLVLTDDREIAEAVEILKGCQTLINEILCHEPLLVTFKGLEYMNDDPGQVDVLYAKVTDTSQRLERVVEMLVERFSESSFMQKQYERVKLHATVMNTLYRKSTAATASSNNRHRETFDAQPVLKAYGDYNFGEHFLDSVQISEKHNRDPSGYYKSVCTIVLPNSNER